MSDHSDAAPAGQGNSVFRFRNRGDKPITLIVEPWADEVRIDPGNWIDIVERGPPSASPLEVTLTPDVVTVCPAGFRS